MPPDSVKMNKADCAQRVIEMLRAYLDLEPDVEIDDAHDLYGKWGIDDRQRRELRDWIQGPVGEDMDGYFQDVAVQVTEAELRDKKLKTVGNLIDLIWNKIPSGHKKP